MAPPPKDVGAGATAPSYPPVAVQEVLDVLHVIGLPWITVDDINKPTQQIAYKVYLQWLETLNGVNQEWLEKRKQEVLADVEHKELYEESLTWILFYREVYVLMQASQARDFGAHDILRPQPKRFRRHLAALINFFRFRDERMTEYDQFMGETEALIDRREELLQYRESAINKIDSIRVQREEEASEAAALDEENEKLGETIYNFKREQTRLLEQVEDLKETKGTLVTTQMDLTVRIHSMNEQVRKLQSRIVTSPQELKDTLRALKQELRDRKAHLAETEHRAKDFEGRLSVMRVIEEDLTACQSLLVSVASDQHRLEALKRELQTLETDYDAASSDYSQVSQTLSADSKQLENAQKRLERMRKTLEDKRLLWKKREEDWSRKWDAVEGERWKRSEEVTRKSREAKEMERDIEAEHRQYDTEVASMIKQRNELVRLAETYMEKIASRLDWDGEGLVTELEEDRIAEEEDEMTPEDQLTAH